MEIPHDELAPETLEAVLREVVTRDGTDYGAREATIDEKVDQARRALRRGLAVLTWDEETRTCNLLKREGRSRCPRG